MLVCINRITPLGKNSQYRNAILRVITIFSFNATINYRVLAYVSVPLDVKPHIPPNFAGGGFKTRI